jgi:glycoside/pentoside/hexuronide:cation symporter, GPH family
VDRKVSLGTKIAYSLGAVGEGLFNRGYEAFAWLYFVAVLGMSPLMGGIAMLVATLLDAFTDPLVGSLSDSLRSRHGRRHPFLYAGILPFALSWFLLLSPPEGLDPTGLFLWFLVFSILMRQSLTLFHVPHLALGAELTDSYQERASIAAWRVALSFIGTFGAVALFIRLFFPETEAYPESGMLNPAGYPNVAFWGALLIVVTAGASALATRREIPNLPVAPASTRRLSSARLIEELSLAWQNRSFRALFIGQILFLASFSITEVYSPLVRIYFWGLTSNQISALVLPAGVGFVAALFATPLLHKRFDRKPTVIVSSLLPAGLSAGVVIARLLGIIPDDDGIVMTALLTTSLLSGLAGGIAFISAAAMMGDVAQEVAHTTGRAVTGVLFAGTSFAQKCSSGVAHFVAAAGLEWLAIEKGAPPSSLAPEVVAGLGLISLTAAAFAVAGVAMYFGYRIDRSRHAQLGGLSRPAPGSGSEPVSAGSPGGAPDVAPAPAALGRPTPTPQSS